MNPASVEQRSAALCAAGACAHALFGGHWLFRQDAPSDALYLLLDGQLEAWAESAAGPRLLGVLGPGEWVGEAGALSGRPRSAGVRAARDSRLLRLDRANLGQLCRVQPELALELAAAVAERLHCNSLPPRDPHRPRGALALMPLDAGPRIRTFVAELSHRIQRQSESLWVERDRLRELGAPREWREHLQAGDPALPRWLADRERAGQRLVFVGEPDDAAWTGFCLRQSDRVLRVADAASPSGPHPLETLLAPLEAAPGQGRLLLLLLHPGSDALLPTARAWLQDRQVDTLLHLRIAHTPDFERLLRVLNDTATGLVLGGGAARGFAHLGVYRALIEAGEPVDFVGGSSIGAILGAAIAKGWSPDAAIAHAREAFVQGRPFSDYTLPLVAMLRGARMEALLRSHLPGLIEDLPLPFYCVSSNLASGALNLHRSGELWRALRASAALPGVLPPAVIDGELAVDGAVLDNLPVEWMRSQPVGHITAVDLGNRRRRQVQYAEVPGPLRQLWLRLRGRPAQVPGLASVVLKSMELGSAVRMERQAASVDRLLRPPVQRFGMTDVRAFDAIVDAGYRHAIEALQASAMPSRRSTPRELPRAPSLPLVSAI